MSRELFCPNCEHNLYNEFIMKKHKLLFECAQDSVLYVRSDGQILDANESAIRFYSYTYEELLSLTIHDIRHPSTRQDFDLQMKEADENGVVFESIHVRKDGAELPVEVSVKGTLIGSDIVRIHIIRDIAGRKLAEKKILELANNDPLTGIANRGFLLSEMDKAIEYAMRGKYKLAVMLFDVDGFKAINDNYGHHAGDTVLKTIAARAKAAIRNTDIIGRLGGDEFVIIQPMVKDIDDVEALIERLFAALSDPIDINEGFINIKISIGVSLFPDNAINSESLIKAADIFMYKAKKQSGNSYSLY